MKLYEYEAKGLLKSGGIPVPKGYVISSIDQIIKMDSPVLLKAQILTGGRGKAGGIRRASNIDEAKSEASFIFNTRIREMDVKKILIEEFLEVKKEYYVSITIDRSAGLPLLIFSEQGGVDIETVPISMIGKLHIHPFIGLRNYAVHEVLRYLNPPTGSSGILCEILRSAWLIFWSLDCDLLEINPLVLTKSGDIIAADAKMTINDDAMFRHRELSDLGEEDLTPLEKEARNKGITLVQLQGGIGVIANGAGLTMATLDSLSIFGGQGGIFMDLGGTDDPEKVKEAFELLLKGNPKVVLINIFGGITKCDTVAKGVIEAMEASKVRLPVVARIRGVNEDIARRMLLDVGINAVSDLSEACRLASEIEEAR